MYLIGDYKMTLYRMLAERPEEARISHKEMPSWEQHVAFLASRPYDHWYFIDVEGNLVGNTYLTDRNEIGIHLSPPWRGKGIGGEAIDELCRMHYRPYYLANIAPGNQASISFFESKAFYLVQHTYRYDHDHR